MSKRLSGPHHGLKTDVFNGSRAPNVCPRCGKSAALRAQSGPRRPTLGGRVNMPPDSHWRTM